MSSAVYYPSAPRCLVTFTDVLPEAARITIYRTADARTMEVRGAVDIAAGSPFVMDYEVAPGVLNAYRARMYASDGRDLGYTPQVTVVTPGDEGAWLQQPLAPETAMRVRLSMETGRSIQRHTSSEILFPEGANVGRIIGGQRRGVVTTVRIYADLADLGRIDAMMGTYDTDYPAVLLLRTPPLAPSGADSAASRLPRLFYMGVPEPEEFRDGMFSLAGFNLPATEVTPPYPGLVRSLLRRRDIDAAFTTRAARSSAYASRLARDQDYSKAGLAG